MKRFQRTIEDFSCEHCTAEIKGDGYTNHCPRCLWSKHVDVFPGDRAAACGGLMEPYAVSFENGTYIITHRCLRCRHVKRNKTHADDVFEQLVAVTRR